MCGGDETPHTETKPTMTIETPNQPFTIYQGSRAIAFALAATCVVLYQGEPHDTTQPVSLLEADDIVDETPDRVWCYGE